MKKFFTFIAFITLSFSLLAVERVERNLIQNRVTPESVKASLVMDRAWVPYPAYSDRAGWDKMMGPYKADIIKNGEKYLDYEWKVVKAMDYLEYERSGNRRIMEDPLGANNNAIAALFAAELAEGQGRFVPQIINGVFHTCEMTSWSLSAHLASLSYSHRSVPEKGDNTLELTQGGMSQMFSWIYYYLKDEMDKYQPEFSRRLKDEIVYRELDSYLERTDLWWMGIDNKDGMLNNWDPWCSSNALISFMLMEDDPDRLTKAVMKSIHSVDEYLNRNTADGGIEEGPSYWGHAPGKLYDYLNALYMITGGKVSIFDEKQVKDMGEYIVRSYVGDGWVVNFADASARGGADALDLIYRYGKAVDSDLMKGYAEDRVKDHPFRPSPSIDMSRYFESLRYADEFLSATDAYEASPYTWYPQTQFHYMNNSEGVFVATRGGNNGESHNHNDIGSFILYYDNLPVMIDVGVGTYTRQTFSSERYSIWTMQSGFHSVPAINGVDQKDGGKYRAADCKSTPTSFSADIAGAYPEDAKVQKWVRSYKLEGKAVKVTDVFSLKEAVKPNVVHFMTWGSVDASVPGIITVDVKDRKMELKYDSRTFDATVETIAITDRNISRVWGSEIYRIVLTAKKTPKSGTYSYTITRK